MEIKQFLPSKKMYQSLRRIKDIFFRYDIVRDAIIFYKSNEANKVIIYCKEK
jgi:hypothetical protein